MKSDWKTSTIGTACSLVTDGSHSSPKSVESGEYMVSVKDFTEYGFDFTSCRRISSEDYEMLKEKVTEARVAEYFREICHGKVTRYELDGIHALNFVLDKTLGGGVTRSLALDKHGKTLGMALLEMEV